MLNELVADISLGFSVALGVNNVLLCTFGVVVGMFVGVLPGIGAMAAMAMLFPLTFHMDTIGGLIMLGGIYYGTAYGGSTAAILLNIPGTTSSAVTCLEGHPIAKQGRGGVALFMAAVASFIGGSLGIVAMMLFSPLIVKVALNFGAAEYFSLILAGLIAASVVSYGSMVKGLSMVVLGMLLGTVGMDMYTATPRFTFGILNLMDGVSLVALAMGIFGMAETIDSIRIVQIGRVSGKIRFRSMIPTRDEVGRSWLPALRGTGIGSFFGALPGTGPTIASFVAYTMEQKLAKDPSRFGKGAIEGIASPEAANNAADQTAFIPTLTLGIPGSPPMALILGVLMIHGISPGPKVMIEQPELFWGLVMSFWIGNFLLMALNIPLINVWIRVLSVPYHILYPCIVLFIAVGVFTVNFNSFEVLTLVAFGVLGYGMRLLEFPPAPMLLGFILGPMIEENFRRAMIVSRGQFDIFVTRPISLAFLLVCAVLLVWGLRDTVRAYRRLQK
jgi:TctA family transporter